MAENRRCGAVALPDWKVCAAHLAAARAMMSEDEIKTSVRSAAQMIHVAGVLFAGMQFCTRCGDVLTDYRGAQVPVGQEALAGWALGAFVETGGTNPTWQSLTTEPPTCEVIGADAMAVKILAARNEWKWG